MTTDPLTPPAPSTTAVADAAEDLLEIDWDTYIEVPPPPRMSVVRTFRLTRIETRTDAEAAAKD